MNKCCRRQPEEHMSCLTMTVSEGIFHHASMMSSFASSGDVHEKVDCNIQSTVFTAIMGIQLLELRQKKLSYKEHGLSLQHTQTRPI